MKENLFLFKCAMSLFSLEDFYCYKLNSSSVSLQGSWNRDIMAYVISLGASYSRCERIVTLTLKGVDFVFCYN